MAKREQSPSTVYAANFAAGLKIPDVREPHFGYGLLSRLVDFLGSLLFLLVTWPVLLISALLIKLDSPGQVLFRHRRLGLKGYPFRCYKFRTMYEDAARRREELKKAHNVTGPRLKLKDDPRITRVGRLLRRFSIDEFPQMLNVLQGHMSLVGPRPLPIEELEECTTEQLQRLAVKPGLTCIWQVSGRSEIDLEGQIRMDLDYIEKRSLWLDLKILAKTPWAVFGGRGAF
jgi:lipopolysaccharide/colanic/teichoic acid biosynthesis glycosyltransferase